MAEDKSKMETFGAIFRDVVSALRDSVIFLLFILLLFLPTTIKERLVEAGFTKGKIAGFEWEGEIKEAAKTTKAAGQTVVEAAANYDNLIDRLAALEKKVANPALKADIESLGAAAATSRSELAKADREIKRSLAVQQQIVTQIAPSAVADSGWIFLGKVNEDKSSWEAGSPQTIRSVNFPISRGTKLTIRDDVYLRGDGPSNSRSSAPVLAVVKTSDTVEITDLDYSRAKAGGWFVWARVKRV